jgi:chaperonin GroES
MRPIKNNILFKPLPPPDTIKGIFVPESCREQRDKGTIVAVGEGTRKKPMLLKEGMTGYRVHGWGTEVIIGGEIHYLMDADAILSIE